MAAQPRRSDSPTAPTRNTSGARQALTPSPLHRPARDAEGRNLAGRALAACPDPCRVPPADLGRRSQLNARSVSQHLELLLIAVLMVAVAVGGTFAAIWADRYLDARDEATKAGTIGMRAATTDFEGVL